MVEECTAFKSYLETLSSRELIKLADQSGVDIPPDLDRLFIIRELLDNAFENGKDEGPSETPDPKISPLPKQYHVGFLEVLPRDPRWVYVFWEIKAQDREQYEKIPAFEGYALRALEYNGGTLNEAFTVPVDVEDNSWYMGFPPGGGSFCISLWVRGLDISLFLSRPFTLPRFFNKALLDRPLIRLSGAGDFDLLRDADRRSRRRS